MFIRLQHHPTVTTLVSSLIRIKSTSLLFGKILFALASASFEKITQKFNFYNCHLPWFWYPKNAILPIHLTYFNVFSNTLSGRPHHLQKPSFTALSLRRIFMLSFIHKTHALGSLCLIVVRRNYWYEPQFSRISPKISPSDSLLRIKNFRQQCWIQPAELF